MESSEDLNKKAIDESVKTYAKNTVDTFSVD